MNTILTKEFLEQQYSVLNKRVTDIAKKTGYSYSHLQSKIKQFGISRRPQYKDLAGKKFGKLTVVNLAEIDHRQQARWKCLCDCGGYKVVRSHELQCGNIKSCGCIHRKRYEEINGAYFSNIKAGAKRRNLEFTLKIEDIWKLFLKQNRKCALSGMEIGFDKTRGKTTASIDRIDSNKGYTIDNVQWVHKEINRMKSNHTDEEFLELCQKVVKTLSQ